MEHTVKSKYKNPDLYIATLKKQVDEAWRAERESYELFESEKGSYLTSYVDKVDKTMSMDQSYLGKFSAGDDLIIHARVIKVVGELNASSITFDQIKFRRRDS